VAIGLGERLLAARDFDSDRRHATQLLVHLRDLLDEHGFAPGDLAEVYVSLGPGSFTGTRVGVTVARTLAQALDAVRLVGVGSADVIAVGCAQADWDHLAVCLAGKHETIHATLFSRDESGQPTPGRVLGICTLEELARATPPGTRLVGEGLNYLADPEQADRLPAAWNTPRVEPLWQVARARARAGGFSEPARVLPIYPRKAEAVRLWELRHGPGG
jgi:tRNA threonylcarbamoyladenosine biosynthesis protein TsaB